MDQSQERGFTWTKYRKWWINHRRRGLPEQNIENDGSTTGEGVYLNKASSMLTTQGRDRRLLGVFMVLPAGRPFFPPPAFSFRMSHSALCLLNSCTTRSQLTTLPQKEEGLVRDWCCQEYQMQQTGGVLDCQLHHMLTAHHTKKAWSGIGAAGNIKCSRLDCFGLSAAPHTHSSPHYHRRKKAWSGIGAARNIKCSRQVECWTVSCTTCSQLTTLRRLGQGLVLLGISNAADWTVLDCQLHHTLTVHHTTTEGRKAWSGVGLAGNIKCSRQMECWTVCAPSVYSFLRPIMPFHVPKVSFPQKHASSGHREV